MRTLSTIFFSIFLISSIMSQITLSEASMSEGLFPSLTFDVKGDKKNAEKTWKDYTKKLGKLERDRRSDEYELLGALIATIDADNPVTMVAKFEEFNDITRVNVWLKSSARFMSAANDPNAIEGAKVFLNDYRLLLEKDHFAEVLDDEEKELRKMERDLEKLKDKNDKLHRDIQKAKDAIAEAERDIEQNLKDQKAMSKTIEDQKEKVKEVSKKMNKVGKS